MMMRPEYRQHIEPRFKTKIEQLIRCVIECGLCDRVGRLFPPHGARCEVLTVFVSFRVCVRMVDCLCGLGVNSRPSKEEAEEELTPCPHCQTPLPATDLDCPSCKNNLPYCIVTVRRCGCCVWRTLRSRASLPDTSHVACDAGVFCRLTCVLVGDGASAGSTHDDGRLDDVPGVQVPCAVFHAEAIR